MLPQHCRQELWVSTPQERFLEIVVAPARVEESNESTNLIFVWQHHPKSYAAMVPIDSISTFLGEIVEGLHWDHHCYIQQTHPRHVTKCTWHWGRSTANSSSCETECSLPGRFENRSQHETQEIPTKSLKPGLFSRKWWVEQKLTSKVIGDYHKKNAVHLSTWIGFLKKKKRWKTAKTISVSSPRRGRDTSWKSCWQLALNSGEITLEDEILNIETLEKSCWFKI